jgi:hypothetical protein
VRIWYKCQGSKNGLDHKFVLNEDCVVSMDSPCHSGHSGAIFVCFEVVLREKRLKWCVFFWSVKWPDFCQCESEIKGAAERDQGPNR